MAGDCMIMSHGTRRISSRFSNSAHHPPSLFIPKKGTPNGFANPLPAIITALRKQFPTETKSPGSRNNYRKPEVEDKITHFARNWRRNWTLNPFTLDEPVGGHSFTTLHRTIFFTLQEEKKNKYYDLTH